MAAPEQTLWQATPSLKALLARVVSAVLFAILLPVGAYVAYPQLLGAAADFSSEMRRDLTANRANVRMAVVLFVVALVLFRLARLGWQFAVLRSQRYRLTNQRLTIETGVFSRSIEEIDMRTVDDLAFHQTFMERLLDIGTVTVMAADKTAGRRPLVSLDRPREVRELIRNTAYQATGGQLFTRQT